MQAANIVHTFLAAEGIHQVHATAPGQHENMLKVAMSQKLCDVVR